MSAAAMFPQSAIGMPKEVQYVLPPSLDANSRSFTVHQQPNGITSVTGASVSSTVFVANSAGLVSQAFSPQQISFDIPSGQAPSVFLDTAATTLSFRLTWTVSTASSATNPVVSLIGGASSFFDQLTVYSNNTPVETINGYGPLANMAINSLVNYAERFGGITAMGCDVDSTTGADLAHANTGTFYYTFTIPLMSIIGQSTEKWLPIGLINNLQLFLQTAAQLPVSTYCTAVATQPVFAAPVLDQFILNLKYVDLGPMAGASLLNSLKDGKLYLKSQTYTNSNVAIPSGSSGATQSLLQVRNSSVKSLVFYNAIDKSAACPNGYFDAVNPASTKCQVIIGGSRYPNREMNPSNRPTEAMLYYMDAWGQRGDFKHYGGVVQRNYYGATIPSLPSGCDQSLVVPASGLRTYANQSITTEVITKYPNEHFLGVDLEKSGGVLFSGVNTRASPPYVEQNLAVASTSAITLQAWAISDLVLEIDAMAKQMISYI